MRVLKMGGRKGNTASGCYDDPRALERDALAISARAPGVYLTLNPCVRAILARCANRYEEFSDLTSSDRDIAKLSRMLVDIDPRRPSGTSSSNAEHDYALEVGYRIRDWMVSQRWKDPMIADSGNGCHLLFPLPDLPNNKETAAMVKAALQRIAKKFNDDMIEIDPDVFNPARITRFYGTPTRKTSPGRRNAVIVLRTSTASGRRAGALIGRRLSGGDPALPARLC
jgi:hypothetical protein